MNEQEGSRGRRFLAACVIGLGASIALSAGSATPIRADGDDGGNSGDWPTYNHDISGSRYNPAEHTLSAQNASGLHVLWQVHTPAPVSGTPVVVSDTAYAGDMSGMFYAVTKTGAVLWSTQLAGQITASALVTDKKVIVGDISGNLYGLSAKTGKILWQMKPDSHPLAAIWGSPALVGNYVAVGVASNEESYVLTPGYSCCSTRGSLVLLDPETGKIRWQTFTVTDAERAAGSSGASIWSTPTYDSTLKLIDVTTGNNFSQPTTLNSDAVIAYDANTGKMKWSTQLYPNDEWNFKFPYSAEHPDADFGDSAQVYTLSDGRRVVGAGQKSGFYHVLDAKTGALIHQNQVEAGGTLGGLFSDSAVANGVVFANGVNWPAPGAPGPAGYPVAGDLFALSGDGSQVLWTFTSPLSPDMGGVAVANSVVYFTSAFPGAFGRFYALDAANGAMLLALDIGISQSGPAVSNGQIYVGTGDAVAAAFGYGVGPGTITALGL